MCTLQISTSDCLAFSKEHTFFFFFFLQKKKKQLDKEMTGTILQPVVQSDKPHWGCTRSLWLQVPSQLRAWGLWRFALCLQNVRQLEELPAPRWVSWVSIFLCGKVEWKGTWYAASWGVCRVSLQQQGQVCMGWAPWQSPAGFRETRSAP